MRSAHVRRFQPSLDLLECRVVLTALDMKITTYDFGGQGALTANLMTGDVSAQIDVGAGIVLDTTIFKSGSIPKVDLAGLLAAVTGSSLNTSAVAYQPDGQRDQFLRQNPGAYFASERFADYMSPSTLASEVAAGVVSFGATTSSSIARLTDILTAEMDDIVVWGQRVGASSLFSPKFFTSLLTSLTTGSNFSAPGLDVRWYNVPFKSSMSGGLLDGQSATVPHLAFAIIPTGIPSPPSVASLIQSFEAAQSSGLSGALAPIVGDKVASMIQGGLGLDALNKKMPGLDKLKSFTASDLEAAVAASGGGRIVDLARALPKISDQITAALKSVTFGNNPEASVNAITLDLATMSLQLKFTLRSRQVFNVGEALPKFLSEGIGTAVAKFQDAARWAGEKRDQAIQAAEQAADFARQKLQGALDGAKAELDRWSGELNSALEHQKKMAKDFWAKVKNFFDFRPEVHFVGYQNGVNFSRARRDSAQAAYTAQLNQQGAALDAIQQAQNAAVAQAQENYAAVIRETWRAVTVDSTGATTDAGQKTLAPSAMGGDVYTVEGSGRVYNLTHDGELWTGKADRSGAVTGWALMATGVKSFALSGSKFYCYILFANGQLQLRAPQPAEIRLSVLDGLKDFRVAADGTIYGLKADGQLVRGINPISFTAMQQQVIATDVTALSLDIDGTPWVYRDDGSYQRGDGYNAGFGGHWTTPYGHVVRAGEGSLYRVSPEGVLLRGWDNSWTPIATGGVDNPASLTVDEMGSAYFATRSGVYNRLDPRMGPGVAQYAATATDVRVSWSGRIYRQDAAGGLWAGSGQNWAKVADHVTSYSLAAAKDAAYVLKDDARLYEVKAADDVLIADHVVTYTTQAYDLFDYLKDDGTYWTRSLSGGPWTLNKSNVQLGSDGQMYTLDNSLLYRARANFRYMGGPFEMTVGWVPLTGGIDSFAVAPNGLVAVVKANGELWLIRPGSEYGPDSGSAGSKVRDGVRSVVVDAKGTAYALDRTGVVAAGSDGTWTTIGDGFNSIALDDGKLFLLQPDELNLFIYEPATGTWQTIPRPSTGQGGNPGTGTGQGGNPETGTGQGGNPGTGTGQGGNPGTGTGQGGNPGTGTGQGGNPGTGTGEERNAIRVGPSPTLIPHVLGARAVRNRRKLITSVSVVLSEAVDPSGLIDPKGFLLLVAGKRKHSRQVPVKIRRVVADPQSQTISLILAKPMKARALWLSVNAGAATGRSLNPVAGIIALAVA